MNDIDRIARQLVNAEPPADMEARILARLDAQEPPTPARGMGWWLWRAGVPAGLATLVVAAGVSLWPADAPRMARVEPSATAVAVSPTERAQATDRPVTIPDVTPVRREPPGQFTAVSANSVHEAEVEAWMSRRIPALGEVAAMEIAHLNFDPLNSSAETQPAPLSITPLIMTTLPLEPLQPGRVNDR